MGQPREGVVTIYTVSSETNKWQEEEKQYH